MAVLPVRLDEEDIRRIELLVKMKLFRNRSDAIRTLVREGLDRTLIFPTKINAQVRALVDALAKAHNKGELAVKLVSTKPAAELIAEERTR